MSEPTDGGVTTQEPPVAEVTAEPSQLETKLTSLERELEETKADYERRIGGLLNANDRRSREDAEKIERLTAEVERMREWQENVSVESLEPEERAAYQARRTEARVEELQRALQEREQQEKDARERESRRAEAYSRALKLGLPPNAIDHRTAETIEDSIVVWQEKQRRDEVSELRRELAQLKERAEASQSAAVAQARSDRGDTSVPDVGGPSAGTLNDPLADLTDEQRQMVDEIEREMEKPAQKRNSGRIMRLQIALREQGIEVSTQS